MRARLLAVTASIVVLSANAAWAQFAQYTAPGSLAEAHEARQEGLARAVKEARYHLGRLKIDPWFAVREIGYVDDGAVDAQGRRRGGDVTASAGAGLHLYLPIGGRTYLAAHALPVYVGWQERADLRQWTGNYGVGAFTFRRRLNLEATGTRSESQAPVSGENEQRVGFRADQGDVRAELLLGRALSLTLSATEARYRYDAGRAANAALFADLDRDERVLRSGVRYATPRGLSVGLGVESSRVEFVRAAHDRSNRGTSPYLSLGYARRRLGVGVDLVERRLRASDGSEFVDYDGTTGRAFVSLTLGDRVTPAVYVARNLVYTLAAGGPYFVEDRYGLSVGFGLGWRTRLALIAERGTQTYQRLAATGIERRDELATAALQASWNIGRHGTLRLNAYRSRYTSNVAGGDRTVSGIGGGLVFGFGGAKGIWY